MITPDAVIINKWLRHVLFALISSSVSIVECLYSGCIELFMIRLHEESHTAHRHFSTLLQ